MAKYTYPEEKDLQNFVAWRYRKAWVWQSIFLLALLIAIISARIKGRPSSCYLPKLGGHFGPRSLCH